MKYTLDRFKAKPDQTETPQEGELSDAVTDAAKLSTWAGSLGRVLDKLDKKRKANTEAKKSMATLMLSAKSVGEEHEDLDVMGKLLGKMLKFIGKRIFKAIVRPILQFAARMAMNIIRIAARAALRFLIWPVIELVGAALMAALASPVGWAVLAGAAAVAGGYLWLKGRKPEIVEVDSTAPSGAVVGEAAPEVAPAAEAPKTGMERALESVRQSSVGRAIEGALERPKIFVAKKGAKFQGFSEEMDGYIRETAAKYPVLPEDELRGFIKMEGGWTGKMSPTGAIGTGQFTADTWNRLISRGGAQIGMTPVTGIYREEKDASGRPIKPHIKPNPNGNFRTPEDPRFDRRVNTLATGLLAAGNAELLRRSGLPVTGANLYMMHNIGPGIIPVMKGQPASAATLAAMRLNGMVGDVNTPEKFLQFQKGRYETAYQDANTKTRPAMDMPQMQNGVALDKAAPSSRPEAVDGKRYALAAPISNQPPDLIAGPKNTIVRMQ